MAPLPSVLIVNMAVSRWKDDLDHRAADTEKWLNDIIGRDPKEITGRAISCEVCGAHPSKHDHHIAGRKHDSRIIRVCIGCHDKLSARQPLRDARWWKADQPEEIKTAFFLWGIYDILELRAQQTDDSNVSNLAPHFVYTISELLRRT